MTDREIYGIRTSIARGSNSKAELKKEMVGTPYFIFSIPDFPPPAALLQDFYFVWSDLEFGAHRDSSEHSRIYRVRLFIFFFKNLISKKICFKVIYYIALTKSARYQTCII